MEDREIIPYSFPIVERELGAQILHFIKQDRVPRNIPLRDALESY